MDNRYSIYENQLLFALTVALLAIKTGMAMDNIAVRNCIEAIELHCQTGNRSAAFDMSFCQFTGGLYQKRNGKRHSIGTLRINHLGQASVYRTGPPDMQPILNTNRIAQYRERKQLRFALYSLNLPNIASPSLAPSIQPI